MYYIYIKVQPVEDNRSLSAILEKELKTAPPAEADFTIDDIDLSYIPTEEQGRVRTMLQTYESMWSGTLGEITATTHHIDLKLGTHPIAQQPYRAGPHAREAEEAEVSRMLEAGVIVPAQSEWASPVVLIPKPDGSLRFRCIPYSSYGRMY